MTFKKEIMKRLLIYLICIITFLALIKPSVLAQTHITISLSDAIELSRTESPVAKRAVVARKNAFWDYKIHRANLRPKLSMSAVAPTFSSSVDAITQADGSIALHEVSRSTTGLQLQIDQPLPFLGAELFVKSGLNRYDNFKNDKHSYGGFPVEAGISMPLFRYNKLRWDNKIAPIQFKESKLKYIENIELSSLEAIRLFFELALWQSRHKIAENNYKLNSKLFEIAKEKYELGKISKSELLQVQLMYINSDNALQTATQNIGNAELNLKSHLGIITEARLILTQIPELPLIKANQKHVVDMVRNNSSKGVSFTRRSLESKRNIAIARGNSGVSGSLYASIGYATQFNSFDNIPSDMPKHQKLELGFSMPILDWGRTKAVRKRAEIKDELTEVEITQDRADLDKEAVVVLSSLKSLQIQRSKIIQADSLANERYNISHNRYLVGDISVIELNLAQNEKDNAIRASLIMNRDIWMIYYRLRGLTLFDYIDNKKIQNEYKNIFDN
jgi:outer membrane protein TolC